MKKTGLQDSVYNWLTIKVVLDARPDDSAAVETEKMFRNILKEDYLVDNITVTSDDAMYYVEFEQNDQQKSYRFPREMVEMMLNQIKLEPDKFINYPLS